MPWVRKRRKAHLPYQQEYKKRLRPRPRRYHRWSFQSFTRRSELTCIFLMTRRRRLSSLRSVHVSTQERISLTLLQAGGLKQMDVKGSFNLLISSQDSTKVKLNLSPLSSFAESLDAKSLQFKYHPNLARATGGLLEEEIKLKDSNRSWPVGTPLGVLRWRAASKDESLVPLSSSHGDVYDSTTKLLTFIQFY